MKNLVFCYVCMIFCAYHLYGKNTIAYAAPGLWYDGFVTSMTSQKISEPTRFQITWDDKNLYVVIDMHGKHLRRNKEYKYRPGIWPKTESVEIFLDTAGTKQSYFQIVASKDGIHWDSRTKRNPEYWKNVKWRAENIIDEDGHWKMRFILPFDAQGMRRPVIGDTWYFNVCRNVVDGLTATAATWADVGRKFQNPSKFAALAFGTPAQYKAVKEQKIRKELNKVKSRAKKCKTDTAFQERVRQVEKALSALQVTALSDELEILETIDKIK